MEEKHKIRIEAVKCFLAGERPSSKIYRSLNKNKQWFYFWLNRYQPGHRNWYRDMPKINKIIHNKTNEDIEELVCNIRKRLIETKYAQIGAIAIQWEFKKLGLKAPPVWTINRIIKRNGLVSKPQVYEKRNKTYPEIKTTLHNQLHQLDIVGPRYLGKGKGNMFYNFNLIDVFSNFVKMKPYKSKKALFATEFLIYAWQGTGIPKYLQVDNEIVFKGSNRHPRTFGDIIKLCLNLGVEIIFVPEAEPWRQGFIERFNDVYDKMFFRIQFFNNFDHLRKESKIFEHFHNKNHCYSKLKGKTPSIVHSPIKKNTLPEELIANKHNLPFKDGRISFVRLTDKKGRIKFFTESFLADKNLINEYVKGTIFTRSNLLKLYYDNKIVKTYKYKINRH